MIPRYSPSRLQTYSSCGMALYLEKVKKVPLREAVWFVQGTAVHEALEGYERSFRTLDPAAAEALYVAAWDRELAAAREKQPDESMWMVGGRKTLATDTETRFQAGIQQVHGYIDRNLPGDDLAAAELIPGEAAVETGFELDCGEFSVLGYIDFVREEKSTGRLIPEDWKTGRDVPADPYQLATYKIAVEELTGEVVEWGRFWMCRNNAPVQVDLRKYTKDMVRDWYQQLHNGVQNGVYLANPKSCFTCTVRPSCFFAA